MGKGAKMNLENFGMYMEQKRKENNISYMDILQKEIGIAMVDLASIENGDLDPTFSQAEAIAQALGTTLNDLMTGGTTNGNTIDTQTAMDHENSIIRDENKKEEKEPKEPCPKTSSFSLEAKDEKETLSGAKISDMAPEILRQVRKINPGVWVMAVEAVMGDHYFDTL